jgi:hypothetical protein
LVPQITRALTRNPHQIANVFSRGPGTEHHQLDDRIAQEIVKRHLSLLCHHTSQIFQ